MKPDDDHDAESTDTSGLRAKVLRGGSFMAARQAIGVVISLVGVILVTREIGPGQYGRFAACIGMYMWLNYVVTWGIDIYLMRRPAGEAPEALYHRAFTLLMLVSCLGGGLGLALLRPIEAAVGIDGFGGLIAVFFAGLPVAMAAVPGRVKLERDLDYGSIALIELVALVQFQGMALALAYAGFGAWCLVIAWAVQQSMVLVMFCVWSRYLPKPAWSWNETKSMFRFGLGYTASTSTIQMRRLINPLIVTPFAGEAAAGFVGMAEQFVFRVAIVKNMSEKMSVAALAKVQDRRDRVRELLGEGMRLHVLTVGLPLLAFSLVGPWLIPLLMGDEWRPVANLVPLMAIGFMVSAVFGLHTAVLQIYERNWDVAIFNAVMMAVLLGASAVLVPRMGVMGYGWAELMTLPTYLLIHVFLYRQVGTPDYRVALVWTAGLGLLMLHPWLGWSSFAAAGLVLLWPATWTHLRGHFEQIKGAAIVRS
ncbi:MAG: oligosaccharide flippase family protein [Planctomycetota bacterium]